MYALGHAHQHSAGGVAAATVAVQCVVGQGGTRLWHSERPWPTDTLPQQTPTYNKEAVTETEGVVEEAMAAPSSAEQRRKVHPSTCSKLASTAEMAPPTVDGPSAVGNHTRAQQQQVEQRQPNPKAPVCNSLGLPNH